MDESSRSPSYGSSALMIGYNWSLSCVLYIFLLDEALDERTAVMNLSCDISTVRDLSRNRDPDRAPPVLTKAWTIPRISQSQVQPTSVRILGRAHDLVVGPISCCHDIGVVQPHPSL